MTLDLLKSTNLLLRFILELCVLGGLGYWGYHTGYAALMRWCLTLGTPLLAAVVWSVFGAPGSSVQLGPVPHLLLEIALFGSAAVALYFAGMRNAAWVFGVIVIANRTLMYIWAQ